jgi:hypothetical protein
MPLRWVIGNFRNRFPDLGVRVRRRALSPPNRALSRQSLEDPTFEFFFREEA